MGEAHGRGDTFIQNADAVVFFQRRYKTAQHHHALHFARLFHFHYLESPCQRGILLKELLVLGPGGSGDGAQFAACQRRLQQIGCIVLPGLSAGADHVVRFIDEKDDRNGG